MEGYGAGLWSDYTRCGQFPLNAGHGESNSSAEAAAAASPLPGSSAATTITTAVTSSGTGGTVAGTTGDGGQQPQQPPSSSLDNRMEYSPEADKGKNNYSNMANNISPRFEQDSEPPPLLPPQPLAQPPPPQPPPPPAMVKNSGDDSGEVKPPKVRDPQQQQKRDRDGNPKHEEDDRKPSRAARSRPRAKDRDGWHSAVTYKIGEGISEITKLWKESGVSNSEGSPVTLDVRVAADLATTSNRQVRGSQLWGTDIYTEDSDMVAVLMHTGYYCPTASPPPSCISEIRTTIRILPPQTSYKSTLRNSVRSRAWGAVSECSYSIERCRVIKSGGGVVDLEPSLTRIPVVAPTLAPAAMERTITTRSASSNAHRQQKFVQEVTIQYNLCNEPWFKYSMSIVADKGLKKSQYTSARLKKGDVLYLETHRNRYELSYDGEKGACNGAAGGTAAVAAGTAAAPAAAAAAASVPPPGAEKKLGAEKHNGACERNGSSGEYTEQYKWARCSTPLPLSVVRSKGVPLPLDCVEILEDGLGWEEVQWSPTSVWVRGKEFVLARAQFLSSRVDVLAS